MDIVWTFYCPSFSKHLERLTVPSQAQVSNRSTLYCFTNPKETAARCFLGLLWSLDQEPVRKGNYQDFLKVICGSQLELEHGKAPVPTWYLPFRSLKPGLSQSQLSHKHERDFFFYDVLGKAGMVTKLKGDPCTLKKHPPSQKKKDPWFLTDQSQTSVALRHYHARFASA